MKKIFLNTTSLTPEKADFITTLCERALQRTLDDRDAIQRKGTFVLGILSAIIAFGINSFVQNLQTWGVAALIYIGVEIVILVLLSLSIIWSYLPSKYAGHGYDPSKIVDGEFINQDLEKMKIGYSYELQNRINYNRRWNEKTAIRIKRIASFVFLSPIVTLILLVLIRRFLVFPIA